MYILVLFPLFWNKFDDIDDEVGLFEIFPQYLEIFEYLNI